MSLSSLGFGERFERDLARIRDERGERDLAPARVAVEHRGAYQVITDAGPCWAELAGRLRHESADRLGLPAVGDWVALSGTGRIEAVLPRASIFVRKAAGTGSAPQVVAANIDHVFVVTSANVDFNPRRIERYLTAIAHGGAAPVLVVNKADLCDGARAWSDELGAVAAGLPIAEVSALERRGREQLTRYLGAGSTTALVGSSGVGKSTLVNWLLDSAAQETREIREHDGRGRHTTTRRELFVLPEGGALIDTPGMRELGLWAEDGDDLASFVDVEALASQCRFVDCQHRGQPGCAIEQALASGELTAQRFEHYRKLASELASQRERGSPAARRANRQSGRARSAALRQLERDPRGKAR